MAIARKKENPQITSGTEVVFREVIKNEQDLRRKHDKLRSSAEEYRADSGDRLTSGCTSRRTPGTHWTRISTSGSG